MKYLGSLSKRITICLLSFLMSFVCLSTEGLAAVSEKLKYFQSYDMNLSSLEIKEEDICSELKDKLERTSRHFRLSDGSILACEYETVVAREDVDAKLVLIDNSIEYKQGYYQNNVTSFNTVSFNKDGHFLSYEDENVSFSIDLVDGHLSEPIYKQVEGYDSKLANKAVSGILVYEEVFENTDVLYQLIGEDIKESLIIKDRNGINEFYYKVKVKGYKLIEKDDHILLTDGKVSYYIIAPYAIDDDGDSCDNIRLEVMDEDIIKLTIDEDWLESDKRTYPVTIDPTIKKSLSGSAVGSTSVCSYHPDSNLMNQYGALYIGRESSAYEKCRAAVKFSLPSIDESNTIISASLSLYQMGFRGNGNNYIKVAPITSNLSLSSLTWNRLEGNIGRANDYVLTNHVTRDERFQFDITQIVTDWYKNGNNYGLAFVSEDEITYRYTTFTSSAHPSYVSQHPFALITYLSNDGLEDYLTYQEVDTNSMGELFVGHFNGNLIYTINDFSDSGNYLPLTVTHIYNHHQRDVQASDMNMKFGLGFRLNISMKIDYNTTNDYYTLVDEDGTTHYYYKDSSDSSLYHKEFSSEDTIKVNDNEYLIETDQKDIYFDKDSGLIKRIEDTLSDTTQTFTYNSRNQLVSVNDGANRTTYFNYDSDDHLTSITYDGNKTINYSYNSLGQLISITFNDRTSIIYQYDSEGKLDSISNTNEGKIEIDYLTNRPKRVKEIRVKGRDLLTYQNCQFEYGNYQSKVIYQDGYSLYYRFDSSGHTISVSDDQGKADYYGYTNSNDDNKHSLSIRSDMQSRNINLIKNSTPKDNSSYTGSFTYEADSLKVNSFIQQIVEVDVEQNDTYTLSLQLKGQKAQIYLNDQSYSIDDLSPNEYKTYSYTYLANENAESITVKIINKNELSSSSGGEDQIMITPINREPIFVKNIRLEKGSVANKNSLIENGNFNNSDNYWQSQNINSSYDKIEGQAYKIVGDISTKKCVYQIVENSGRAADRLVINGFIKSDCIAINSLNDNVDKREVGIKIELLDYYNDVLQSATFDCLSLSDEYQFISGTMTSNVNYQKVKLSLICNNQIGTVYYDDIALYIDSFGSNYSYDELGRVTSVIDSSGNITNTHYQDITVEGKNIDVIDRITYTRANSSLDYDQKIEYQYDQQGLRSTETITYYYIEDQIEQTKTIVSEYHYDDKGNLLYTSVNGVKTYETGNINYGSNYISSYIDETGNSITLDYDQYGKLLSLTDGNDNETIFDYDNYGQLSSLIREDSRIDYGYNSLGQLLTVTKDDQVYSIEYDQQNRQKKIKLNNEDLIEYEYDQNGNIISKVRNDDIEEYEYDQLDRLIAIKENDEYIVNYYYGNDGNIGLKIDHLTEERTRYEYDLNGNLTYEVRSDGFNSYNEYDLSDKITTTGYKYDLISQKISYLYDGLEEIYKERFTTNGKNSEIEYYKDDLLRLDESIYRINSTNILTVKYDYLDKQEDKTTTILDKYTNEYSSNIDEYQYEYDGAGNITSFLFNRNGTTYHIYYSYDQYSRVIREDNELLSKTIIYSYDALDNITSKKIYNYSLDENLLEGNIIESHSYIYDDDKLISINGQDVEYDEFTSEISEYKDKSLSYSNGKLESINIDEDYYLYTYNSDGYRVSKTKITIGNRNPEYNIEYGLNGDKILTEKRESGQTSELYYLTYEYDSSGQIVGFVYSGTTDISLTTSERRLSTSIKYTYLKNALGDIVGIIDETGQLKAEYQYDSYGNCTVINHGNTTIGNINPFRYRSYYYDTDEEMYYLNSRYYDPSIGRFISKDDIENVDLTSTDINLYVYCKDNPINYVDENGEKGNRLALLIVSILARSLVMIMLLSFIFILLINELSTIFKDEISDLVLEIIYSPVAEYILFSISTFELFNKMWTIVSDGIGGFISGIAISTPLILFSMIFYYVGKKANLLENGVYIFFSSATNEMIAFGVNSCADGYIENNINQSKTKICKSKIKIRKIFYGGI